MLQAIYNNINRKFSLTQAIENPIEGKKLQKQDDSRLKCEQIVLTDVSEVELQQVIDLQQKRIGLKPLKKDEAALIFNAHKQKITYEICTKFISQNIPIVMAVAEKLSYMKNLRLYRLKYNTFEEYVQTEFDFTRRRAYQLTSAYDLAKEINTALEQEAIVNESQARKLSGLKVYKDFKYEDKKATAKKRLTLVKNILAKNKKLTTMLIAEDVDRIMIHELDKQAKDKPFAKYDSELTKSISGIQNKVTDIFKLKNWSDQEKGKLKTNAVKELETLIDNIKKI